MLLLLLRTYAYIHIIHAIDMPFKADTLIKLIILNIIRSHIRSGELQLGDRERKEMQENIWRDIATIVCEKCVDKSTQRPLTVSIVERAMTDIHYNINPKKNAKQQALDVIKQLMEKGYPVERAKIVLRLTAENKGEVREVLKQFIASVVSEQETPIYTLEFAIEPSQFKNIESVIHDYGVRTSNKCSLEIVSTGQAVATDTFV